ncbi:hypothetical protein LKK83_13925 [Phormidium sp. CCY1219]|nr:hypothetical protein [Phormidium sp. CCY1219]
MKCRSRDNPAFPGGRQGRSLQRAGGDFIGAWGVSSSRQNSGQGVSFPRQIPQRAIAERAIAQKIL